MAFELPDVLKWVSARVVEKTGHPLRGPEVVILEGTWRGLTYEQMAEASEYSTNYLMRDVAPKLWRQLSAIFDQAIGKTNLRVALETLLNASLSAHRPASPSQVSQLGSNQLPLQPARSPSLYGYRDELTQIKQLLVNALACSQTDALPRADRFDSRYLLSNVGSDIGSDIESDISYYPRQQSCLIGIWGLNGVGKSLLCETVTTQVGSLFDAVIWRSLKRKPLLSDFCNSVLHSLGTVAQPGAAAEPLTDTQPEQPVECLLNLLTQHAILLVIEDVESILQPGHLAGEYAIAYRPYEEFFQLVASSRSSLLLNGTEAPTDWVHHKGHQGTYQSIYLHGLSQASAAELLSAESLSMAEYWPQLIDLYQGHPLALQSVARVIREIFSDRVDLFLQQPSQLFTNILRLLAPSFERLSEPESNLLYWLSSQSTSLSLADIQRTLPPQINPSELISILDSLKQRSYLSTQTESTQTESTQTESTQTESAPPAFKVPALIKAYALHRLLAKFNGTFNGTFNDKLNDGNADSAATLATDQLAAGKAPGTGDDATLVKMRSPSDTSLSPIISLSASPPQSVQLSHWFHHRFEASWQPLGQIFDSPTLSSMRLRNTYHLKDETFVKRCKSVQLEVMHKKVLPENRQSSPPHPEAAEAILIVAIRQETEGLYKICVQAQPAEGADRLPESLELKLLDAQQILLARVQAVQADTFIQLPYFRGKASESFSIELALNHAQYAETFLI